MMKLSLRPLSDRINLFYILSFVPLLAIFAFTPLGVIIPFYGFLLLVLKQQKLHEIKKSGFFQKILGAVFAVGSFFVYYALVVLFPTIPFYEAANYAVYIFGLFLIFFEFSALKEAFSPLFLIVAATSSSLISAWLKPLVEPFTISVARILVGILSILGINAYASDQAIPPIVTFVSLSGRTVITSFEYECLGVYSALVFSIILIVILFEDTSSWKVRSAYAIVGFVGTFALNIVRVTVIYLTDYFQGEEIGAIVHYVIGYALFSIWLGFFFYMYSKRQTLRTKIRSLLPKTTRNDLTTRVDNSK
jgi:exosortase/archaeosortase family protein